MNIMAIAQDINPFVAFLIGMVTIFIGIFAILKPAFMSSKFGITVNGSALPYVISTGVRDVFMGLSVLVLAYQHEWKLLGAIQLLIGFVAIGDFLNVFKNGDKKTSLVHFAGAGAVFVYGTWLLIYY